MKITKGNKSMGDTHTTIIHRVLNDCGYNDPEDKAEAIEAVLGKKVRVEELSPSEAAQVAQKLVRFKYGNV